MPETPKIHGFVLRPLPSGDVQEPRSRAERERVAVAYWDGLSVDQEAWVLRKMGFRSMGADHCSHVASP